MIKVVFYQLHTKEILAEKVCNSMDSALYWACIVKKNLFVQSNIGVDFNE